MVNGSACYKAAVELPARTEVAILGGGFAGCATAWALATRGVDALVIEREPELGRHASGRGAGLGRQLAEDDATTELTVRGARLLRDRFPAAWAATGGILCFDDPGDAEPYVARARRFEVAHERIAPGDVAARWPALAGLPIGAALWVPGDGVIDIRALLAAYAAGRAIARGVAVTAVEPGRVVTARGPVAARVVVEATGAWAGPLVGDPPLEVYKRHLFVVDAAPAAGAPFVWHLGRRELYVRGDGAATLACACDATPTAATDQRPDAGAEDLLRDRLAAAPALATAPIARRWACQRAFAPDRRMRIGRDPARPWLVWAAALGGHGATASGAVGERAADAVVAALR